MRRALVAAGRMPTLGYVRGRGLAIDIGIERGAGQRRGREHEGEQAGEEREPGEGADAGIRAHSGGVSAIRGRGIRRER